MLTVEDFKNLITILNRIQFANLNEAKYAMVLELRLKEQVASMSAPPQE